MWVWVWVWVVVGGCGAGQWRAACLWRPFDAQRKRGAVADAADERLLQLLPVKLDDAIVDLYAVGGGPEVCRVEGDRHAVEELEAVATCSPAFSALDPGVT